MTTFIRLYFPNRATEDVTITGPSGGWLSSAPVTNVATSQTSETARSTDATTAHTKIYVDLLVARKLRGFAIKRHNLSSAAQWRILLGTSTGGSEVLATAWTPCWYLSYLTDLAVVGVESNSGDLPDHDVVMELTAFYSARYITFEIDDTTNPDGWVEIGKVFAGGGLIPENGPAYGKLRKLRVSQSTVSRSDSGSQWRYRRRQGRNDAFSLELLSEDEAVIVDELQRQLDITDECLYVEGTTTDYEYIQRRSYIALLHELSPVEFPLYARNAIALAVDELM